MDPQNLRFLPTREPGPQLRSADSSSPMSIFKQFFSESAVSTLCHNTNAQAAKATANGCKYKWKDVSTSEMYNYIGLIFYMAMVKLSSIRDYWRQSSAFSVPFPATVMSRDRYRTISWNVHMSHPDADKENDRKKGTAEHDRLFRVKPLMNTIHDACVTSLRWTCWSERKILWGKEAGPTPKTAWWASRLEATIQAATASKHYSGRISIALISAQVKWRTPGVSFVVYTYSVVNEAPRHPFFYWAEDGEANDLRIYSYHTPCAVLECEGAQIKSCQ
ncbi:uncharacterized protein [Paramisgurnus dabryanus]|uniref:uncharacterized protein n=1 Tax=Paramisgurnus dabryanus TaxID=90735 RepID=UPI003CCF4BB0